MAKILIDNPNYVGVLHAHTDAKGSVAYNEDLSKRRAKNAKAVLVEMGIDADRIKTSASGKGDPFAKNTEDDTGRRFNRRVELFIQDKNGKDVCTSIPPSVSADLKAK
jgi:outer membrane protein OmpA-like peptidoglycan-associated protein